MNEQAFNQALQRLAGSPASRFVLHREPMLFLDRLTAIGPEFAECEWEVRKDFALVVPGRGVPSYAGIEYMAQCVAVHSGARAHVRGEEPPVGLLLGLVILGGTALVTGLLFGLARRLWGPGIGLLVAAGWTLYLPAQYLTTFPASATPFMGFCYGALLILIGLLDGRATGRARWWAALGIGGLLGLAIFINWISLPRSSPLVGGLVLSLLTLPVIIIASQEAIRAVPQSIREASYGLGATKSETIKQVILPAALPVIVSAILLAASRAIGETMIVVLGAGAAAAQFTSLGEVVNPFEAMTTVTVKIVGQLTGDTDFSSPEALVAFALGLTLFIITLALNVYALYIVRKYREQYE